MLKVHKLLLRVNYFLPGQSAALFSEKVKK